MTKISLGLMRFERKFAAFLCRIWIKTIRFSYLNHPNPGFKCILSVWHRDVLLMTLAMAGNDIAAVISASQDGELIAGPAEELGYTTIRGSSTRMGAQAYREMLRMARSKQLGITPDGPKGPVKTIHPGIVHIAYQAKIPIIPVAVAVNKEWVCNSWDKFRVPKPFSCLSVVFGTPFHITDINDPETAALLVRTAMDEAEKQLPA